MFEINIWEHFVYIEKFLDLSSAHDKWGQKQMCCIYNFGQCRLQKHVSNTFPVRFLIKVPEE